MKIELVAVKVRVLEGPLFFVALFCLLINWKRNIKYPILFTVVLTS